MRKSWFVPVCLTLACSPAPPIDHVPQTPSSQPSAMPSTQPSANPASAETRHPKIVVLINAYQPHDRAPGEPEARIVEAVKTLRQARVASPLSREERTALLDLFLRLRTSRKSTKTMFRGIYGALLEISDPLWESKLIELITTPIVSVKRDQKDVVMDQVYWQVVAAEILGELRSEKAVVPLTKVVLSALKGNIAATATYALVRIGGPAVARVGKLVNGEDPALAKYAESELLRAVKDQGAPLTAAIAAQAKNAHMELGLKILGSIGTAAASTFVMKLAEAPTKALRQAAAATLCNIPRNSAVVASFKRVYAETGIDDQLMSGNYAKEALISCAANMVEPGLAAWVVDDALKLGGNPDTVMGIRASVLSYALSAATVAEWPKVEALFESIKKHAVKDQSDDAKALWASYVSARKAAKTLLDKCSDDASCYLTQLPKAKGIVAAKSGYMTMLLGGAAMKPKVVDLLLTTEDANVRRVLASAIVGLSPQGDVAIAKRLEDAIIAARAADDAKRTRALKSLKIVAVVLQSRKP